MSFTGKTTGHGLKGLQSGSQEGARKTNKSNWHTECLGSSHKLFLPTFHINPELEFNCQRAMDLIKHTAAKIYYEQNMDLDQHLEKKTEGARYEKMYVFVFAHMCLYVPILYVCYNDCIKMEAHPGFDMTAFFLI